MRHTLVSAKPGEPGGFRTGHVGEYRCSCGAVLPGIGSYKKHRTTSLHDEAVERVAHALVGAVLGWEWDELSLEVQQRYRDYATVAVNAAKVRR
jgi:hypothetical protein